MPPSYKPLVEEPVTTRGTLGPLDEEITQHPCFAQISASRMSGTSVLFGSEFRHHHSIRLTVHASAMHRQLSRDWHHTRGLPLVEVEMSENQWATFVSSLNVGGGVPCTLRYARSGPTEQVPGLPKPIRPQAQFRKELRAHLDGMEAGVSSIRNKLAGVKMTKADRAETDSLVVTMERDVKSSIEFIFSQFAEHMEEVVERAKSEVNAHALNTQLRLGAAPEDAPVIRITDSKRKN